jgi:cell division protein FtsW (lipid II flippase)
MRGSGAFLVAVVVLALSCLTLMMVYGMPWHVMLGTAASGAALAVSFMADAVLRASRAKARLQRIEDLLVQAYDTGHDKVHLATLRAVLASGRLDMAHARSAAAAEEVWRGRNSSER